MALVAGKRGATRLGFALLLRFYTERGRFPRGRSEIPDSAVEYVARQLGVSPKEIAFYDWSGRTIKAHRVQIRRALGFRECSVADADKLIEWLVANVTQTERNAERVREELLVRCREERIEPPTGGRMDRIVRSALHRGEELLVAQVSARLPETVRVRLFALVATAVDDESDGDEDVEDADGPVVLAAIRSEPGNVSLNTMLTEITKLEAVRAVGVPDGCSPISPRRWSRPGGHAPRWRRPATCATTRRRRR